MRSRLQSALSFAFLVLATSCNFTKNITISEDGTDNVTMDMDASKIMAMAGKELAKEGGAGMDTTIYIKDMLAAKKDSIAKLPKEEQERLKKPENFKMKMLMDPDAQQFKVSLFKNFKKVVNLDGLAGGFDQAILRTIRKKEGMPDIGFENIKQSRIIVMTVRKSVEC